MIVPRMRWLRHGWVAALAWCAAPALADIEGAVSTPDGRPVEGASVVHVESGARRTTDGGGHFAFRGIAPPATLRIEDPRFEPLDVALDATRADAPATLALTLTPKQPSYVEELVVTARRSASHVVAPLSFAVAEVSPDDLPAPPASVVEMATTTPGVADSGQGGRFQAYSIRGIGGQRVFTTVADVRIVTERRAGATASFILPSLLESVEVVRGPASTYFGSGALGGVVQALPRRIAGSEAELGWASQGNEGRIHLGWGAGGLSLALAGRRAEDGSTPDGATLPNHYEQWSGVLQKSWERPSGTAFELLVIPAVARDIGKPNTLYPARVTAYPEEDHLLVKFTSRWHGGWRLAAFVHPNDLATETTSATTRAVVQNDAFDLGVNAGRELTFGGGWTAHVGVDLFGRHAVVATERTQDLAAGTETTARTLDGREDQGTLHATLRHAVGRATLEFGASFTAIEQANVGAATTRDAAGAGFVGLTLPLSRGFEIAANAGSGIRFPALTERFFSGSTGAGSVVANASLDPERSLSTDLGARYFGQHLFLELFAFRNAVDDYIEQTSLAPGVTGFANLVSGTIAGLEHGGAYTFGGRLSLHWAGMYVEGRGAAGAELAEIPAPRVSAGGRFAGERWDAAVQLEQRFAKQDPGPSEQPTEAAQILSASVGYRVARDVTLRLSGTNLLDETYLPSADELALPAPGRALGLNVRWARE